MAKYLPYLLLGLLSVPPVSASAAASTRPAPAVQDDEDDEETGELKKSETEQPQASNEALVEVVRGAYVKMEPGFFDYLPQTSLVYPYSLGAAISSGPSLRLHLGTDVLTSGGFGLSAELSFSQFVNNGLQYTPGYASSPAQGDTRTFLYEAAVRPTVLMGPSRRFALYARLGGGVAFLQQARTEVPDPTLYSDFPNVHPKATVSGGLGFEYYTRLAHFSFTLVDGNFLYVLGAAPAYCVNFAGFRYTF